MRVAGGKKVKRFARTYAYPANFDCRTLDFFGKQAVASENATVALRGVAMPPLRDSWVGGWSMATGAVRTMLK